MIHQRALASRCAQIRPKTLGVHLIVQVPATARRVENPVHVSIPVDARWPSVGLTQDFRDVDGVQILAELHQIAPRLLALGFAEDTSLFEISLHAGSNWFAMRSCSNMHSTTISVSGVCGAPLAPIDKFTLALIGALLGKTGFSTTFNLFFDPAFSSRSSDRARGKSGFACDDDGEDDVEFVEWNECSRWFSKSQRSCAPQARVGLAVTRTLEWVSPSLPFNVREMICPANRTRNANAICSRLMTTPCNSRAAVTSVRTFSFTCLHLASRRRIVVWWNCSDTKTLFQPWELDHEMCALLVQCLIGQSTLDIQDSTETRQPPSLLPDPPRPCTVPSMLRHDRLDVQHHERSGSLGDRSIACQGLLLSICDESAVHARCGNRMLLLVQSFVGIRPPGANNTQWRYGQ